MDLDSSILESKNQTTNVETSLRLTVVTDKIQTRIPVAMKSFWVPDLGHCFSHEAANTTMLACRAGLGFHAMAMRIEGGRDPDLIVADVATSSLPLGLSPDSNLMSANVGAVKESAVFDFIPRREMVSFRRKLNLRGVRLAEYVVGPYIP